MTHANPFTSPRKTCWQKLKVGENKRGKIVCEKLPIYLVKACMVAPCSTSSHAHFFDFFGFHYLGHTSRSVLACVTMPQTLSWQNAGQTARYWQNAPSTCTPQNMFPLPLLQNLNAHRFLRAYRALPSKKKSGLVLKHACFYKWTLGSAGWIRVLSLSDVVSRAPRAQIEQAARHNYFKVCSF